MAGVTGDIGGGVTATLRRSWDEGESNLRAGDFQELVVVVVVRAVVVFNVVDLVVVEVVGLTDCKSCCSSRKTSALLVVD